MMANSEDNAELRARVMASLKKFEKIPENVAIPQSVGGASNDAARPSISPSTPLQPSEGSYNAARRRRYKFSPSNYPYGYAASQYAQPLVSSSYNQASFYPQYAPYMNQASQSSYAYPAMMGMPQPYMMPQQPYVPNVGMEGFTPVYGQIYPPRRAPFPFRRQRSHLVKKPKLSSGKNSDTEYSTDCVDDEGGNQSQRVPRTNGLSARSHSRRLGSVPRLANESIDLTLEEETKCKPENYLREDIAEHHIVDAFPVPSATEASIAAVPAFNPILDSFAGNSNSIRYKLLSAECEKQNSHLLEAQENLQRLISSIRIQQIKLNENSEVANAHLVKIERLQNDLARERQLHEACLNESRQIQQVMDDLNMQFTTTERFVNSLNENVMKKKVFMSQMQVQEHKNNANPTGSLVPGDRIETEKLAITAPTPTATFDLMKKFPNTKSEYHHKLVEAYHKILENKLLLFKTRKSLLLPFAVNSFVAHLEEMFNLKDSKSSVEIVSPEKTFEPLLHDSKLSLAFTFTSIHGLADVNESFGIIDKDDDLKLEEHLVELVFYFYLLNDSSISSIEQELLSISSTGTVFSVLEAVERFSKLLSSLEFHPHVFKEKPRYMFKPFFQGNFTCCEESIKEILVNLVPRFFSVRLAMYLGSSREIDNSAFMAEDNEFERLIESDPQNTENWINYALAVLPTNLTLENIWAFPKENLERCLSILSRAIEVKNDCDELWVCYLDLFCYQTDYNADELAEMFSFALEYFSIPSIASLMHISNVRDLNAKISLAKNFLKTSWDRIDLESTARAILVLILLYQNAKYEDCGKSLIYGLFFTEFTDIQQLLQYDDIFFTLPESFQHKSFVNTFFTQTNDALKIKALLWNCAIHFLFHHCLPDGLFYDYPYEYFADLDFEFLIKVDISNVPSGQEIIAKQSKFALEYLMHENESNAMLKHSLALLSGIALPMDSSDGFVLNQAAPNNPVELFNREYARFIRHFIPTYDTQSVNFASINRIIQRSLGVFNDFERITTSLPLQKTEALSWINYFICLVKNKTSPKDMERLFEEALVHVEGPLKIFIWREFVCWLLLTQSTPRIRETLERFVEDAARATEFHSSMRIATNMCAVGFLMQNILDRIGDAIDHNKKLQIVDTMPADVLPIQLFCSLDLNFSAHVLLSRIVEVPTSGYLVEMLKLVLAQISSRNSGNDTSSSWNIVCAALSRVGSITHYGNVETSVLQTTKETLLVEAFPQAPEFDEEFTEEDSDDASNE